MNLEKENQEEEEVDVSHSFFKYAFCFFKTTFNEHVCFRVKVSTFLGFHLHFVLNEKLITFLKILESTFSI